MQAEAKVEKLAQESTEAGKARAKEVHELATQLQKVQDTAASQVQEQSEKLVLLQQQLAAVQDERAALAGKADEIDQELEACRQQLAQQQQCHQQMQGKLSQKQQQLQEQSTLVQRCAFSASAVCSGCIIQGASNSKSPDN